MGGGWRDRMRVHAAEGRPMQKICRKMELVWRDNAEMSLANKSMACTPFRFLLVFE